MYKEQVDELYHLLRVASNTKGEEAAALYGLARHLLAGGDYLALIQYSAHYGRRFLVEPVIQHIKDTSWQFSRIVEFGAGLGWFGRGLVSGFNYCPCMFVDKRPWTMIDVVADLETEVGKKTVLSRMLPDDVIVMADVLHCLDDPKGIMSCFSQWPLAALEYCSATRHYLESYSIQISRYGAQPVGVEQYKDMFPNRKVDVVDLDPYILLLVDKEEQ